ncbi:MAG: DUF2279 domain-containing protein [Campylobacterales bacterium]|nr:DUF2279 domain-containing protein [Campylobacterales bacterium]
MRLIGTLLLLSLSVHAEWERFEKVAATNAAIASAIIGWGALEWDYGHTAPHGHNEGWFERDTSNGGADKSGHFLINYMMGRGLSSAFESWGYTREEAAAWGALSAFAQSTLVMEIGDSTSLEHGFSYEDAISNLLGATAGYLWYRYPSLASKIDFRVEYAPDWSQKIESDFTTDYESMKHLMAIKASGFEALRTTSLQYLELHFGYYSRHFDHDSLPLEGRERYLYAGVGINLSHLLSPVLGGYSGVFNYLQLPYTYLEARKER